MVWLRRRMRAKWFQHAELNTGGNKMLSQVHVKAVTVAFIVSVLFGRAFAACQGDCTDECKEIQCFTEAPPSSWACTYFQLTACDTLFCVRDPQGGICAASTFKTNWEKCPDCNPECIDDPSEAEDCVPEEPGCTPMVDCCDVQENMLTNRWLCAPNGSM